MAYKTDIQLAGSPSKSLNDLKEMLLNQGYRVQRSTNSEQTLALASEMQPDLILLDIAMPGPDGCEICRRLKANERTHAIPVLFLDALDNAADKAKAFAAGGAGYIPRPFFEAEVLACVNTHLTLRNTQKALEREVLARQTVQTERDQREFDLNKSQEIARLGSWSLDLHRGQIDWSDEMYRLFGLEKGTTPTLEAVRQRIVPADRPVYDQAFEELAKGNVPDSIEYRLRHPDGQILHLVASASTVTDDTGKTTHLVGTVQDVTEQKQAELALRESEGLLRQIAANYPNSYVSIVEKDMAIGLTGGQEFAKRNLDPTQFIGLTVEQVFGENAPTVKKQYQKTFNGEVLEFEMLIDDQYQLYQTVPLPNENGQINRILVVVRNDTERRQAEEALRQRNQAIEQSPVSVMITDTGGDIQYVNPKFCQVTGYSATEVIGQNPRILQSGLQPPVFYRELWKTLIAGKEWRGEFHNRKKNGELYWELASITGVKDKNGNITHYVAVKEDITQRKRLEEETMRQERLAAVGQLAAGIAHDFNNLLTTIIGNAELLRHQPGTSENAKSSLSKIVRQGERAATLTRQLLDFSRQTINKPQPLDLKIYLNETLKFIKRTIPENIHIQLDHDQDDCTINADSGQMQQIITNLAVNARDAMPNGGTLHFNLSRFNLSPADASPCPQMDVREWVRLEVTDTGSGIESYVLPHIFEPFFTTKEVGRGTGLGLAQIYGIVEEHKGCITVDSQPGRGATFSLYFPAHTASKPPESKTDEDIAKGQGEIILLVEDNQMVLEVTRSMLQMLNYHVLPAQNGEDALALFRVYAEQIVVVLTDMVMPDMDGLALTAALQAESPEVKVLLMSGYNPEINIPPKIDKNIIARLNKPLDIYQLARALRAAFTSYSSTA